MKKYTPIRVKSHYSLLNGLSKPKDIIDRCDKLELDSCAITDIASVSGHISFLSDMKSADKKPLLGLETYVTKLDPSIKKDNNVNNVSLIAKNYNGWRNLIELISIANEKENFHDAPRIGFDKLLEFGSRNDLIIYTGYKNTSLYDCIYSDSISSNWRQAGKKELSKIIEAFGKENVFLEIQLMGYNKQHKESISGCLRDLSKDLDIKCVASQDSHYVDRTDADDHKILIASGMRSTLRQASESKFGEFFKSDEYHIPDIGEMVNCYTEEEIENTNLIASMVDDYSGVLRKPQLPNYECPDGMSPDEYLRKLCRDGWNKKILNNISQEKHDIYAERVKSELEVLQGAGLSSYFLVVSDILNYVRGNGWLPGAGRGSCAGSMVSYLIGITEPDPIKYDLIFERFYNAGRNSADHISMPDIDIDIPRFARGKVIQYLKDKYGVSKVGQMVSFQTMKGRGAIKDVLRAYGNMTFTEMNDITQNIIEEHKISDELEEMKKNTGEKSIIRWCLENNYKDISSWCKLDGNRLVGPMAERFAQAIRLEGTKTSQSKHPAGVVIAPVNLNEISPMYLDQETGAAICGFEMEYLEQVGGIKFDVLGLSLLDKCMGVQQDLEFGEIHAI